MSGVVGELELRYQKLVSQVMGLTQLPARVSTVSVAKHSFPQAICQMFVDEEDKCLPNSDESEADQSIGSSSDENQHEIELNQAKCDGPPVDGRLPLIGNKVLSVDNNWINLENGKRRCTWPGCDRVLSDRFALREHIQCLHRQSQPNRFACLWPDCRRRFECRQQLDAHISTTDHPTLNGRHQQSEFICRFPGCQYVSSSMNCLRTHKMRIHLKTGKHRCEWLGCDRSFYTKKDLEYHVKKHRKLERVESTSEPSDC